MKQLVSYKVAVNIQRLVPLLQKKAKLKTKDMVVKGLKRKQNHSNTLRIGFTAKYISFFLLNGNRTFLIIKKLEIEIVISPRN